MVITVILCRNFLRSTFGRKIIAIGQDPVAAEMIGIKLLPNQMLSLAISAAFAGLSGGLLAHYITFIQPSIFSMDLSSLMTAAVVCGGMGSLTGPIRGDRPVRRHPRAVPRSGALAVGVVWRAAGGHH